MKILKFLLLGGLWLGLMSCDDEKPSPTRSFYMGFTPWPYDLTLDAVEETYANITANGDIINHHFDNGVPWTEALIGSEFHADVMNDWNYRMDHTPANQVVYLSVCALNPDRNGLALYRGESSNMPLPSPWDVAAFNSTEVKTAYVNYCKRIIDYFTPSYFNMGIEANLLHFLNPDKWSEYVELHEYVYTTLKAAYPQLPIFCSVTGAQLLDGYIDGNDVSLQRLAVLQLLEYSDMYALSFYPHMSKHLGNPYPKESFDELFKISDKPLAIAETGYPAQSFNLTVENNVSVLIESDPTKQKNFVEDLLSSSNEAGATFVIIFAVRDYDQLWEALGGNDDISIAWRDTGLLDEQGQERTALSTWKEYFSRSRK